MAALLLWGGIVWSQVTADIGIWGGTSGYLGDIRGNTLVPQTFPMLGGYFRYNFHQRTSARLMFLTGKVAAEGTLYGVDWDFSKPVQDLSLQVEINYLRYMLGNKKASFTSYVTAGAGVAYYNYEVRNELAAVNPNHPEARYPGDHSVITPTLPFGMGFKLNVGKRMGVGVEYQMRKLFNDGLDDLDDPLGYGKWEDPSDPALMTEKVTFTDGMHNNDWMGFLGVHLTYKIYMGKKPCPAYDSKN